jgi:hypothetical protein
MFAETSDKSIHAEQTIRAHCGQGNLAEEHGISAVVQVNLISSDVSSFSLWALHLGSCVGMMFPGSPALEDVHTALSLSLSLSLQLLEQCIKTWEKLQT